MELMEKVKRPVVEGVYLILHPSGDMIGGVLCVTAFHFIFSTRVEAKDETMFLHTSILMLDRPNPSTGTVVNIVLKDFRRFAIQFPSIEECNDVVESLEALSRLDRIDKLHSFFSPRRSSSAEGSLFQPEDMTSLLTRYGCPTDRWRVSFCNNRYKLCPSYSEEVIIPAKITDEAMSLVAAFRRQGRFPVLCYHHEINKAVILRCGEPLCGPSQKRCREDINLLNACLLGSKGRIFDIRTQQNAQHQMSKGGGVEFPSNYSQWRIEHASMEPLKVIKASYLKLVETCGDISSSSWYSKLETTGWLSHVEQLLRTVQHVVHVVCKEGTSVVVHGTTGQDGTLQVTSLAILLMDPQARTIRGFLQLIEREWLRGGHPFSLRHSHVSVAPEKQRGPMFLLFIDTLWQIMRQFPLSFEFNELLLHILFVHSYSSSYGTFLYDTPAERYKHKLIERTESLWDYILSPSIISSLHNPFYIKNESPLIVSTHSCSIDFWKKLYLRTDLSPTLQLEGRQELINLKTENDKLKHKLKEVRRDLEKIQSEGREYSSVWS